MEPVKKIKEKSMSYSWPFDIEERQRAPQQQKKTMYQIKEGPKTYPWPCKIDPDRTITVTTDDLFSKTKDGTIIKHTGVGCYGIFIPDEDLVELYE